MLKIYWLRSKITIIYSTKKPDKWKKHSVSIFVLTTVFEKMCPHLIWDVLSYLSRKKGISETFLSLGLFISRPRPTASASKMRPRLQKTFPRFPFFYFGNFGQISNQTWTNFSSDVVSTKIETKYYCVKPKQGWKSISKSKTFKDRILIFPAARLLRWQSRPINLFRRGSKMIKISSIWLLNDP